MATLLEILERACSPLLRALLPPPWGTRSGHPNVGSPEAKGAKFTQGVMPGNSARQVGEWGGKRRTPTRHNEQVGYLSIPPRPREDVESTPGSCPTQKAGELGADSPTAPGGGDLPAGTAPGKEQVLKPPFSGCWGVSSARGAGRGPAAHANVRLGKWTCARLGPTPSRSMSRSWQLVEDATTPWPESVTGGSSSWNQRCVWMTHQTHKCVHERTLHRAVENSYRRLPLQNVFSLDNGKNRKILFTEMVANYWCRKCNF